MVRRILPFSLLSFLLAATLLFASCDTSNDLLDGIGPPIENNDDSLKDDDLNLEVDPELEEELEPEVEPEVEEPEVDDDELLGDDFLVGLPYIEDKRISNSYIANPMVEHDGVVRFVFPVVERVNDYWGNSYDGYGNDASKLLKASGDDSWSCEVLWNDYGAGADITVEPTFDKNRIVITAHGIDEANVVVGVRKSGVVIWSWHIWITDYNPDAIAAQSSVGAPYVYSVSGGNGELHRYDGALSSRFVMDRNIGARGVTDTAGMGQSSVPTGTLYYQFGRKDPFPGIGQNNGFISTSSTPWNPLSGNLNGPIVQRRAVENPMMYISNVTNWSQEALSNNYLWNDAKVGVASSGKSIFDPSPAGWKIPSGDLWSDFNGATFTWDFVKMISTYGKAGAEYPAVGYRGYGGGLLTYVGALGYYWSSIPASETSGMHLYSFGSGAVLSSSYRANAQPIRPIKE